MEGAKNNLQFTGDDFFVKKDVCSIVLELPNSALGAKEVRLWARTLTPDDGGGWRQVERGARPAQAVILVEERDAYLGGEPATDGRFLASFAHALEHTRGYTSAEAKRVAATLLPDILPYDSSRPASFPHPWPEMLVRLSRTSVVSIALIRGRATGMGSELAIACDMRFASREKAILSQFEVGAGLVPGGGPMARLSRLMGRGRALKVILSADDVSGDLAERYGYVNRSLPDADLDGLSMRLPLGSPLSTNRQSWTPSAWSTLPACRPISKSNPDGMLVLLRWDDRPHSRESKR